MPKRDQFSDIPAGHIPLSFDAAITGLLLVDAKSLPKTAAAAKKAAKKRDAAKASAKKKPAK